MQEEINRASEAVRDPTSFSTITYLWVIFFALWGGLVRILQELKGETRTWKELLWLFFSESCVSLFVGVLTFYLTELAGFDRLYSVFMISISSYMGGRSLVVFKAMFRAIWVTMKREIP